MTFFTNVANERSCRDNNIVNDHSLAFFPPAKKVAGGYCFHGCLSVSPQGGHVTISHDALNLTVPRPETPC